MALAETLPDMRPALIGSGADALINCIDTQKLVKTGQGDAALMFYCGVEATGRTVFFETYRLTPRGEKLKNEITRCLHKAPFVPAVYNHRKVPAMFYGTVMFKVVDGRPRLRIFSNQEVSELANETNFIGPQCIYPPNHYEDYIRYPGGENKAGSVELSLSVDASGKLKDVHVIKETPPGVSLGEVAVKSMRQRAYLPAFRNGKPVDSTSRIHFTFTQKGWLWR